MLVTGATGFLGQAVVIRLSQEWLVRCASRRGLPVHGGAEQVRIDVATGAGLDEACRGVDAIVHCAGLAHQFHGDRAAAFDAVNAAGTGRVAAAAVRQRVPRIIIASSISVYGSVTGTRSEDMLCVPDTAYGRSKLAGEQAAADAACGSQSTVMILRLATLFGPGDPGNVARLADAIRRRRFFPIGNGRNRKSLLHCADAAEAIARALVAGTQPGVAVPFNVSAAPVEMREIVDAITDRLGRRRYQWFLPAWPVHLVNLAWSMTGRRSPLNAVEKFLSEDVVATARFEAATGFVAARRVGDGVLAENGAS